MFGQALFRCIFEIVFCFLFLKEENASSSQIMQRYELDGFGLFSFEISESVQNYSVFMGSRVFLWSC